jgi:hypothetical protein
VLTAPYRNRSEEDLLGPPFDLGLWERPDDLPAFAEHLRREGLPTACLSSVIRARADLDALLLSYARGLYSCMTVATWCHHVERLHSALAADLDAGDTWARTLADPPSPPQAKRAPDLLLLDQHEWLTTDLLARALGVHPDVAARRRSRGEFGLVTRSGRLLLVRSDAVREALRRRQGTSERNRST